MKFKDKTRGGYPVRILATDLPGAYPVCAIIQDGTRGGFLSRYKSDGRYGFIGTIGESPYDLIPDVPEQKKVVRWTDYICPELFGYATEGEARRMAYRSGGHPVKVTLEWIED